jgi:hypothetical protein
MITNIQIREIKTASSARRFLVRTAGGDTYVVLHPNHVCCGQTEMSISDPDGIHLVKMAEAELIDIGPAPK